MDTDKLFKLTVQAFKKCTRDYPNGDLWRGRTETNGLYVERTMNAVQTVHQSCPETEYYEQPKVQGYTFLYVDGETALLTVGFHWSTEQKHIKYILNHLHRYKAPVKVMVLDDSMLRNQVHNVGSSVASQVQASNYQYPTRIPGDKYLVVMFLDGQMGFRAFDHCGNPISVQPL